MTSGSRRTGKKRQQYSERYDGYVAKIHGLGNNLKRQRQETTHTTQHRHLDTVIMIMITPPRPAPLESCKQDKTPIHKTHKTSSPDHGHPSRPIVTCKHDRMSLGDVI